MATKRPAPAEVTTEELVAATKRLPRSRMSDFDGAKRAEAASKDAHTGTFAETGATYTRLLSLLAEKKSAEAVASAMEWNSAGLELFLSQHRDFAQNKWDPLLKRIIKSAQMEHKAFRAKPQKPSLVALGATEWTVEMRDRLLDAYVDTGSLLNAQQIVGVTPSQFNRELETNAEFSERVKQAKKQAADTLEHRAISDALGGNDKLLSQILRGKDESSVAQLSDAQLARRITGILNRVRDRVAPGGDSAVVAGRAASPPGEPGGGGEASPADTVCDPLS